MGFIAWIFFGLVVGIVAKFLIPGRDPGGFIITAVLAVVDAHQLPARDRPDRHRGDRADREPLLDPRRVLRLVLEDRADERGRQLDRTLRGPAHHTG